MRRLLLPLLAAALLVGADCTEKPTSPASLGSDGDDAGIGWRLAAAYDMAPLIADPTASQDGYLWLPYLSMEQYCGPSRRPSGLGVFEAEAMATGLTPTLALILERTTDKETVPAEAIRVAVGNEDRKILLQPATERRHIAVSINASGGASRKERERYEQLVRTQLEIELCLEHKLGRAWTGADTDLLREAFLLDPPRVGVTGGNANKNHEDRAYFGGQGAPVPALLGPPDACLLSSSNLANPAETVVAGVNLVPSDVWSAGLRPCNPLTEGEGKPVKETPHTRVPLKLRPQEKENALEDVATVRTPEVWKELTVAVRSADEPSDVSITVTYDQQTWGPEPLYQSEVGGEILDLEDPSATGGLRDILARLPRNYPRLGTEDDPTRYAVLLIPNWQIVDALRAIDTGSPEKVLGSPDATPQNGVAALLQRPDLLFVQAPPPGASAEELKNANQWPDLSSTMGPGPLGSRLWGYTVGFVAGRAPIALLGGDVPTWEQERAAQRARPQAMFLFATCVLLLVLMKGLRRVPDLWSRVPQVAMDYWPGLSLDEQEEGGQTEDAVETAAKLTNA